MTRRANYGRGQLRGLRKMALENVCPDCNARPGEHCLGARGSSRMSPHRARYFKSSVPAVLSPPLHVVSEERPRAIEIVEDAAQSAAEAIRSTYEWAAKRCESPIEQILLAQFLHPNTCGEWDCQGHVLLPPSGSIEHCTPMPYPGFYLWPQIKIGPYRVDFVFASVNVDHSISLAIIECDGHDFHERTKQQAQRDKSRDRFLVGRGYRVLRFTGSEIYREASEVWQEIIKITLGLTDD